MRVLAVNVKSGKKSKSSASTNNLSSRFRNGSSLGIGTPTKASRNNINVVRWARFYDELGGGITVPLYHPKNRRSVQGAPWENDFGKRR